MTAVGGSSTPSSGSRPRSGSDIDHGRFLPGVVLGGRYRVVGLVGVGGMGEVYRADDLKLGQTVALKFLPERLARRPEILERYLDEVRTAREVSHPSVCRVHDIGELDGLTYLSMEYVDGEDLGSLLRRIGRLPSGKALELAREICAGLAAAHARGVLHRDLKPANVMIDGRGRARLTDFGLAGFARDAASDERVVGTPGYLAPELLTGTPASVQSDVYALGLVLYELFTGGPPFVADDPGELLRQHREEAPPPPSERVPDLAPEVEAAILRCLEKAPRARPPSALAVSAALPGGDPLSAALAAGETPSPEMVAAAGGVGALRRPAAAALVAVVVLAIALVGALSHGSSLADLVALPLAPEVLAHRAREIVRGTGATELEHGGGGLVRDTGTLASIRAGHFGSDREALLRDGRPAVLYAWHRTGPTAMRPENSYGRVTWSDPPLDRPGMTRVLLLPDGRLTMYERVPPAVHTATGPAAEPDWTPLFEAAGLEPDDFEPGPTSRTPVTACDVRRAWEGADPERPEVFLRIEGAGFAGAPVFFLVGHDSVESARRAREVREEAAGATAEAEGAAPERAPWSFGAADLMLFLQAVVLIAALVLARRNLRSGRGDRRGAFRLAYWLFALNLLAWVCQADHRPRLGEEWRLFLRRAEPAVFNSAVVWMNYVALEPFARRVWPRLLISWTRLLSGRWRDPLVGRDLLVGLAGGALVGLGARALHGLAALAGADPPPTQFLTDVFGGARFVLGQLVLVHAGALEISLGMFLLLVGARFLLRRETLAFLALFVLGVAVWPTRVEIDQPAWDLAVRALCAAGMLGIARGAGLLAVVAAMTTNMVLDGFPLTSDPTAWNAGATAIVLLVFGGLAGLAFSTSTAGARATV